MNDNPFTLITNRIDRIEFLLEQVLANQTQLTDPTLSDEQLFDIKEAAVFIKKAVQTVYAMVSQRKIPHYKRGGKLYFCKKELRDWLKEDKPKTHSEIRTGANRFSRSQRNHSGTSA